MTRGDVIKALEICGTNEHCHSCPYYRCDDCLGSMMLDAKTIIVNSAPVVHGYWKETKQPCGWDEIDCATCSVCGDDYPLGDYGIEDFNELSHYCSNCGAKMDGGKDDGYSS